MVFNSDIKIGQKIKYNPNNNEVLDIGKTGLVIKSGAIFEIKQQWSTHKYLVETDITPTLKYSWIYSDTFISVHFDKVENDD